MSAFTLDLTALPDGLSRVMEKSEARGLGLPEPDWPGSIQATLEVEKTADRISVRGILEARARLECGCCLTFFERSVRADFRVFAERAGTGPRRDEEALARDAYMKFHDGRRLDLREDARESLLLEIPIAPRCREDCAGLCPKCGADLNLGLHECPASTDEERVHGGSQA